MVLTPERPHVFVSYKSEDRDVAAQVVVGLRNQGLTVWWDQTLEAGDRLNEEIDRNVRAALAVLVLWSPSAVGSRWVNAEADGDSEGKLVAAALADCTPRVPFNLVHAKDLRGWRRPRGRPLGCPRLRRAGQGRSPRRVPRPAGGPAAG